MAGWWRLVRINMYQNLANKGKDIELKNKFLHAVKILNKMGVGTPRDD